MEQSKSISVIIAKLKIAYPYYFKDMNDEDFVMFTKMYQEQFSGYNPKILLYAIENIIRTSKFMPTIADIVEACDKGIVDYKFKILDVMRDAGYFKKSNYGELDDIHANRNYEKAVNWLTRGIIPDWFMKDLKEYGFQNEMLLENGNNIKLLEASNV